MNVYSTLTKHKKSMLLVRQQVTSWVRHEAASTMSVSACGAGDSFVFILIVDVVNIHAKV
jgi:hypothetical protein